MPQQRVEVSFVFGQLRQPGLWGKIARVNGSIYEYDTEKDVDLTATKTSRTIILPAVDEGTYMVWGFKGFHSAGVLSVGFALFKVTAGQHSEWQFPGHLAKFEVKNGLLIAKSDTDLQPIYQALTDAKYPHLSRLQDFLRREGKDKTASPQKS